MLDSTNKTYLISNNKKNNTLWVMFGTLVLGALLLAYLYEDKVVTWDVSTLIIIDVVAFIFMGALTFFLTHNTYITFKGNGFDIIRGKNTTPYLYSDFDGSDVTRHYYNGIYTGTSRSLKLRDSKNKSTKLECKGINKDLFAEIVAYIGKSDFDQNMATDVAENYFEQPRTFDIPKENITVANKKHAILNSTLVGIGISALLGLWIYAGIKDSTSKTADVGFYIIFVIVGVIMAGVAAFFIARLWRNNKRIASLPERIIVDNRCISIDGKEFSTESISNVSMVPGNYKILSRDLLIIMNDGSKSLYCFGEGGGSAKLTYSEYEELYKTIKYWCLIKRVNYQSILG